MQIQPVVPLFSHIETKTKPVVVAAVDIEKVGCRIENDVVGIGFVVGLYDPETNQRVTLTKRRICIQPREPLDKLMASDSEVKRCVIEFWNKQNGLWDKLMAEAVPYEEGWKLVAAYIDHLYTSFKIDRWASDNPAFDLGHIDHHLTVSGARKMPLRHAPDGSYVSVVDPTEQAKGLCPKLKTEVERMMKLFWDAPGRSKHMPDDDAEGIWAEYVLVQDARRAQSVLYA